MSAILFIAAVLTPCISLFNFSIPIMCVTPATWYMAKWLMKWLANFNNDVYISHVIVFVIVRDLVREVRNDSQKAPCEYLCLR